MYSYLDSWLIVVDSNPILLSDLHLILWVFQTLILQVSAKKSKLEPTQRFHARLHPSQGLPTTRRNAGSQNFVSLPEVMLFFFNLSF